jgi:hypothetical protein
MHGIMPGLGSVRHGTDVPWTGCARLASATPRVSFYVSLVGGGLRLSGPSSENNGSVRVYRSVMRTLNSSYIGVYTHKYVVTGHEGWTSIGALSEVWVGVVGTLTLDLW